MSQPTMTDRLKKLLPHLGVVAIFFAMALAYCFPLMQGKVIIQSDNVQSQGMQTEIHKYDEIDGKMPLWTNSMFSGMPAYQILQDYPSIWVGYLNNIVRAPLPHPANIIFLYLLMSYLAFILLGFNIWQSLLGAIGYAFMSANFLYLEAGHFSKTIAMAYMPLVIGAVITTLRGRLLFGGAVFALIFAMQLRANHIQIAYYTAMLAGALWVAYLVKAILDRTIPNFAKATGVLVAAALLGLAVNTSILWTTYEYAKDTIRGGSELAKDDGNTNDGLDLDYALRWSYGTSETFTLLIPNFNGGSSNEDIGTSSVTYETLVKKGVPKKQAEAFVSSAPLYFGDQPFTSAPFYFGAIMCFLFVFGIMMVKGPIKWGVIGLVLLSIPLAWGKNFMFLSELFFNYMPLYNKFRDVKMVFSASEVAVVILALYGLKSMVDGDMTKEQVKKSILVAAGVTGGLSLIIALFGSSFMSFDGPTDTQIGQQWIIEALKEDRVRLLRADAFRSLIFVLLAGGALWLYLTEKLKLKFLFPVLIILVLVDLWSVDQRFFDKSDYISSKEYADYSQPSGADLAIQRDPDIHYRVLNLSVNTFNDAITSYQHKSVGGYFAAKLSRYQDMIERHISQNNRAVWNMLNTKYIITRAEDQPGGKGVVPNPEALGNAWYIDDFKMVEGAEAEINALNGFDPSKTAVVDSKYADYVNGLQPNNVGSTIKLTSYHPDHMVYKADVKGGEQFIVFSEVYYNSGKGWEAYIDDKPADHIRVNYILRGLKVPAGEHTIRFDFEPSTYRTGEMISLIASITLFLLFGFAVYNEMKTTKELV